MTLIKTCAKCGEAKPIEHFSPNKGGALGVRGRCKVCAAADKMARTDRGEAAAAARDYRSRYPERAAAAVKKYRESNKEKVRARAAKYWSARPEKKAGHNKKAYHKNRDARIAYAAQWQKDNPAKVRARTSRRRTAKINATPWWVDHAAIEEIYEESVRMTVETGIPHEVDHIIPLKNKYVCGLHVPWNLRVIPAVENRRKGNTYKPT